MPVFKTGAINHSANSPHPDVNRLSESEFDPLHSEMQENRSDAPDQQFHKIELTTKDRQLIVASRDGCFAKCSRKSWPRKAAMGCDYLAWEKDVDAVIVLVLPAPILAFVEQPPTFRCFDGTVRPWSSSGLRWAPGRFDRYR
jgi:hypothetical protein